MIQFLVALALVFFSGSSLLAVPADPPDSSSCTDYTCLYDSRVDRSPSFKEQCESWCAIGGNLYDASRKMRYDANWNNCISLDRDAYLKDATIRPKICKNTEISHNGHGLTAPQVDAALTSCATNYKGGKCKYSSSGCTEAPVLRQEDLKKLIGGLAKEHGICGTVTFNQTDANPTVCRTPIQFTFTETGKCKAEFFECNSQIAEKTRDPKKAFCFTPGQKSTCWDDTYAKTEKTVAETCCLTARGQEFMRLGDAAECPKPDCGSGVLGVGCWVTGVNIAQTCVDKGVTKTLCCGDKFGMPPEFAKGGATWMLAENCLSGDPQFILTANPTKVADGGKTTITLSLAKPNARLKITEGTITGLIDGKQQTIVLDPKTLSTTFTLSSAQGALASNAYSGTAKACVTASDGAVKCFEGKPIAFVALEKKVESPTCVLTVTPNPVVVIDDGDFEWFKVKGPSFLVATVKLPTGHELSKTSANASVVSRNGGDPGVKAQTKYEFFVMKPVAAKAGTFEAEIEIESCLKGTDFCATGSCKGTFKVTTEKAEVKPAAVQPARSDSVIETSADERPIGTTVIRGPDGEITTIKTLPTD